MHARPIRPMSSSFLSFFHPCVGRSDWRDLPVTRTTDLQAISPRIKFLACRASQFFCREQTLAHSLAISCLDSCYRMTAAEKTLERFSTQLEPSRAQGILDWDSRRWLRVLCLRTRYNPSSDASCTFSAGSELLPSSLSGREVSDTEDPSKPLSSSRLPNGAPPVLHVYSEFSCSRSFVLLDQSPSSSNSFLCEIFSCASNDRHIYKRQSS